MSNIKRVQFETTIEAPVSVVWQTMLAAEYKESMQEVWLKAFALLKELCED